MNSIIKKMEGKKTVIGPFAAVCATETIEMLGLAGFDFCIVDGEHGPGTFLTLQNACIAGDNKDLDISIVYRVPENTNAAIGHALDIGAAGVVVPHVDDVESAKRAVKAAKFYPLGDRGMHGVVRAARYGNINMDEYIKKSNEDTMLMIQIEGMEGYNNLDDILEVKGIDGIFIGPYDLSQSMGVPGQVNHPEVIERIEEIIERIKAKKEDMFIGIFTTDVESSKKWADMGVQFIAYQIDTMIFSAAAKAAVNSLRDKIK
ncbi:2-keto-3-deoxy-L-rhamnonate aldolase [Oxobacter pfennigii]|uniref:2-keto-3-deoxy-L-rhamnonate aldolase n=1 Tax=Oxobacter pfennigii TaxID=36849 RepID=A0A0P8W1J0_9CLOT|nr:aldolase/citrate lyase family protein [Oxobacter pfennigii]KPU42278.1 2-keto-3-deoxy-L-rhamnonate aldolase [Oxobacter pfennigii]